MKTLIYSVAINFPISDLTVPLWKLQSKKSNCDFKLITNNNFNFKNWNYWNKYIPQKFSPDYSRYLFVDADTIPGKNFDIDKFFLKNHLSVCRDHFNLDWIIYSLQFFNKIIPLADFNLDNFFNSGVLAYEKDFIPNLNDMIQFMEKNSFEINLIHNIIKKHNLNLDQGDQTLFNLYSYANKFNINFLPPTLNVQFPFYRGNFDLVYKNSAIIHFNGLKNKKIIQTLKRIYESEVKKSFQ